MPLETLMFNLVNAARREYGTRWLPTNQLKWHPGLAAVARGHSADMLKRQYVEHRSPDGLDAGKRISRYGIQYLACGENIGVVYGAASHSETGVYEIHNTFLSQPRGRHQPSRQLAQSGMDPRRHRRGLCRQRGTHRHAKLHLNHLR
ncbi:MAG: CAP domain-containing protein [Chloroflexi bacterium]|nr:CAP domain-containing protein [Chloroflexota bacterium]